ncbi:L-xylulose reductase-like [Physella acuta]|uniref:L-xylulose reductase-like n=1 Tax=Physella acuta TaxID=109671 RepID=UPI0027DB1A33|nr:L-xylulose reductase-like [Physella acuta]XP_059174944.1 L-xylulose reductase-like [Physella acuta]XP_059174945.1 L-xylulose reductase-like [Physella acuta]XP_059174946.1 L-xylulose reductase-like [Physella acuta]XP_059174947.1 L-xylulose reductase-like [Physella acuta]XP_059174949.1 L-xylulose reductase-like [Physella acuta]XP_059174950.1 L-xylulose reductase-like [Physella acuta]XP_059174951.1 L-xylulose reductase-like [Physella acuta]XP_059174952.1 L-xylulose reductase-like [Physella 
MEIKFEGKRALVTGAGKGIGRAIALKLAACGAQTVAVSRSQADLDALKNECPSIEICAVDLSDWPQAKAAVESLGHFDLLVNSAGVSRIGPFVDVKEEDFDFIFNTNVKALFNVSQVVAKSMLDRKSGGSIVHLSSAASTQAVRDHAVYCSSKGAVDSLTTVMALELGPHKIRTNCVNPTATMTDMGKYAWSDPAKSQPLLNRIPLGRLAEVEDVVDAVLWLLSDKASYINGVTLPVEGGLLVA